MRSLNIITDAMEKHPGHYGLEEQKDAKVDLAKKESEVEAETEPLEFDDDDGVEGHGESEVEVKEENE